jgi:aldehyde dehydrogenase (NAD+)
MFDYSQFYIDGRWIDPVHPNRVQVMNPATEASCATISLGSAADIDRAVAAARRAFGSYSRTTVEERLALLARMREAFVRRQEDIAAALTMEIGAPIGFSRDAQVPMALSHFDAVSLGLRDMAWKEPHGRSLLVREPIGVIGLITPWNWPIAMVVCKTLPAIAAGCTVVLKPSEVAPLDAMIFAEICAEAGVPDGVFNLINGTGEEVGEALAAHAGIDAVSFTGSTRAGIRVAQAAAPSIKRVTQELGGKSANIILEDADFDHAVRTGADYCFSNTGQSCDAPTRMLVPAHRHDEAVRIAVDAAAAVVVGDPLDPATTMGPLATRAQFDKVQDLVGKGVAEGAELVAGGLGKPEGQGRGFFVKPTVFANVDNDMTIAREEIFGPVLSIIPYDSEDDAVRIANDSPYGLAGYVVGRDIERARRVAARINAGMIFINYPEWDPTMPFGGYKQSGNGRESGIHGIAEYLEMKSIIGFG